MNRFLVKDRNGAVPVTELRARFETIVAKTPDFKKNVSLEILEKDGKFYCYKDAASDAFWSGFALGQRCAQRFEKAGYTIDSPIPK